MIPSVAENSGVESSNLALAAPFIVIAVIAIFSFALSKVIDRRVEGLAGKLGVNQADATALADWAIDASQAAASIAVPILALENLAKENIPSWIPFFYALSAIISLIISFWVISRREPLDFMRNFPLQLPPAATLGFVVNALACVLVLVLA